MHKLLLSLGRLCVHSLLAGLLGSGLLAGAAQSADFFPHRDGMAWHYDNGERQVISGPYTVAEIAAEFSRQISPELADFLVMRISKYLDETLVSEDFVIYETSGVYSLASRIEGGVQMWYEPPMLVYEGARLRVGDSWGSISTVHPFGLEITSTSEVLGMKGIDTPAGRFNALLLRQDTLTDNGVQNVLDIYFVPTVGIVRFETRDGGIVNLLDINF